VPGGVGVAEAAHTAGLSRSASRRRTSTALMMRLYVSAAHLGIVRDALMKDNRYL
jgi:hypothetical protein